jgi:hypothetical protein
MVHNIQPMGVLEEPKATITAPTVEKPIACKTFSAQKEE